MQRLRLQLRFFFGVSARGKSPATAATAETDVGDADAEILPFEFGCEAAADEDRKKYRETTQVKTQRH